MNRDDTIGQAIWNEWCIGERRQQDRARTQAYSNVSGTLWNETSIKLPGASATLPPPSPRQRVVAIPERTISAAPFTQQNQQRRPGSVGHTPRKIPSRSEHFDHMGTLILTPGRRDTTRRSPRMASNFIPGSTVTGGFGM
eukprot:TRINITY_DN56934_c0_g1_i1.p1 TRINITY_DN56934_c0_g1~~TRINITY_DN56934_c0_g1_i1.p1  ORF type:complete len:140 (+),score=10.29 TRINITY_DN56934_c0_g1_i1:136-555(+)